MVGDLEAALLELGEEDDVVRQVKAMDEAGLHDERKGGESA
jgi:hypothetical protein